MLYFYAYCVIGQFLVLELNQMETRNPSPPPGFDSVIEEDDHIGDSAYSKRWLYSLILRILTKLSQIDECIDDADEELESILEEDLCKLWDITSDQSLLESLRQFQLVPIFAECIHKSKCHRLIVNWINISFTYF